MKVPTCASSIKNLISEFPSGDKPERIQKTYTAVPNNGNEIHSRISIGLEMPVINYPPLNSTDALRVGEGLSPGRGGNQVASCQVSLDTKLGSGLIEQPGQPFPCRHKDSGE